VGKNAASYKFEKRKKEIARQKKQEEKRQRHLEKKQEKPENPQSPPADELPSGPAEGTGAEQNV
jgi:hypothetical protein